MEIFKFNPSALTPTYLEGGEIVSGAKRKMWIERYRNPGEFSLVGKLSSGLQDQLPPGTFISHKDTLEVMIVENHEISEDRRSDPDIQITGRSLDSYLEQRVIGANQNWASPPAVLSEYELFPAYSWIQAVEMINEHIRDVSTIDDNDALDNVIGRENVTIFSGVQPSVGRTFKRGTVHQRLMELLEVDDCGIRSIRRNSFGVMGNPDITYLDVYRGADKTDKVIFSWVHGELDGADYLWSIKREKNTALVVGRYVETPVYSGATGYNRRWMIVDGSDLDDYLSEPPVGAERTAIVNKMITRGQVALHYQNQVNITRVDVSRNTRYLYRTDYDVGDLITVSGNRGETATMRVIEYVEIEDETGGSGHPTLALV